MRRDADLLTHVQQRAGRAFRADARADMLAERHEQSVDLDPVGLRQFVLQRSIVFSGVVSATRPQRLVTRWTWMSTPISGRLQAMPSVRLAHLGPTPRKASSVSRSHGSVPP